MARSSSAICDGPSSPMLTPTCEPTSFRFACEMPATRIWSYGAGEESGERGGERHLAARAETGGHADHVLFGDETFGGTVREFLEKFFREGGIFRVAVHRHDALVHFADAGERGAVGFARGDLVAEFVTDRRIARGRGVVRARATGSARESARRCRIWRWAEVRRWPWRLLPCSAVCRASRPCPAKMKRPRPCRSWR